MSFDEAHAYLEGEDEIFAVDVPAEIYHLKAAGEENWSKMDELIRRVEDVRGQGMRITADMYTYTAGATGLDAAMPPWAQ